MTEGTSQRHRINLVFQMVNEVLVKKLWLLITIATLLLVFIPAPTASGASICSSIQNQQDYFEEGWDRGDWTTLSEIVKYHRYIELILRNPQCVSSRDFRNAREFVAHTLENCPPRKGVLLDLYGLKSMKMQCAWASKTQKKYRLL